MNLDSFLHRLSPCLYKLSGIYCETYLRYYNIWFDYHWLLKRCSHHSVWNNLEPKEKMAKDVFDYNCCMQMFCFCCIGSIQSEKRIICSKRKKFANIFSFYNRRSKILYSLVQIESDLFWFPCPVEYYSLKTNLRLEWEWWR